jgi:hypothetical protein
MRIAFEWVCLNFVVKIRTDEGYKTVIIDMQKLMFPSAIQFRQCIEILYRNGESTYRDKSGNVYAHEIYCIFIFILWDDLDDSLYCNLLNVPVLTVNNNVVHDYITGERLDVQNEYITGMPHKSWIIQVPCITQSRRNDLEKLLCIFDQNKSYNGFFNGIYLRIEEDDFPEKYIPILWRLVKAIQNEQIEANMEFENNLLLRDHNKNCTIKIQKKAKEAQDKALAEIAEKEKAIEEKKKTIEKQDKDIEAQKKTIEALDKAKEAQDKAEEALDKLLAEIATLEIAIANR